MCEYLAGSLRSLRLASVDSKRESKEAARRMGYHVQIDSEVPPTIQGEIRRYVRHDSPAMLFNFTTKEGKHWNCIEETLSRELDPRSKRAYEEVPFFRFVRTFFEIAHPSDAILIFTEGAEVQWFPLVRRKATLGEFLCKLYDQYGGAYDVSGIYDIT